MKFQKKNSTRWCQWARNITAKLNRRRKYKDSKFPGVKYKVMRIVWMRFYKCVDNLNWNCRLDFKGKACSNYQPSLCHYNKEAIPRYNLYNSSKTEWSDQRKTAWGFADDFVDLWYFSVAANIFNKLQQISLSCSPLIPFKTLGFQSA